LDGRVDWDIYGPGRGLDSQSVRRALLFHRRLEVNGQTWVTDGNGSISWYSLPTALPPNGQAGGDLSGSYPNPMVAPIGGAALPRSGSITKTNSANQLVAAVAGTDYVAPNGNITGNAATATALASAPTTCNSGNYARGVGANGNATGCTPANAGTVTSVTFTGDGTVLSLTPSAADTSSGTVAATLNTQTKNTALMGPSSGSAANPTFRSIVAADLPTQTLSYWFSGVAWPIITPSATTRAWPTESSAQRRAILVIAA
jgi:hypothetical protein